MTALIITAELDATWQGWLEGLRRAHYPPGLNQVPAHLTLFHALPPSAEAEVRRRLARAAGAWAPMALQPRGWRHMGRGVALDLAGAGLDRLWLELVDGFSGLTGAQDEGRPRFHVTIQNKVSAAEARATLAMLPEPPRAPPRVVALRLWRYLQGPWEALARHPLRGLGA